MQPTSSGWTCRPMASTSPPTWMVSASGAAAGIEWPENGRDLSACRGCLGLQNRRLARMVGSAQKHAASVEGSCLSCHLLFHGTRIHSQLRTSCDSKCLLPGRVRVSGIVTKRLINHSTTWVALTG